MNNISTNHTLCQLTKLTVFDGLGPTLSQFSLTGFSGPVTLVAVSYFGGGPDTVAIELTFVDSGDAPYTLHYVPGGFGPGLSIFGVDGTVGPAFDLVLDGP